MPLPETSHISQSENNNRKQIFCIYGNGEVALPPTWGGPWKDPKCRISVIEAGVSREWLSSEHKIGMVRPSDVAGQPREAQ